MRVKIRNNKGQNFVEYTLILGIVGVALFSMQTYFKRGIQSVIKVTADDLGQQGEPFKKFAGDQKRTEETVKDQLKISAATQKKYNFNNKYYYSSTSSENVTTQNKGNGNIVRTTNEGTATSDDISY